MIYYRLKNIAIGFTLFLLMISHLSLFAQVKKPKLFVTISPKTVIVGQPVNVKVSVVVPTWLLGAPEFPQLDIPGAIAILPEERAENVTQTIDGETWSGISRTYLIYPQEVKEYELPKVNVKIVYSIGGIKKSPKTEVLLPQYKFKAEIPEEAKSMDYFLATSLLRISQKFDRKLSNLKAGDSFTRTIKVEVKNTMAMFIPPVEFDSLDGITIYTDPAKVENKSANRVGFTGGERIEKATYFIQKPGEYEIPEIEIKWWNLKRRRISISKIEVVKFYADSNASYVSELAIHEDTTLVVAKNSKINENYWRYGIPLIVVLIILYGIEKKYLFINKLLANIVYWNKKRKVGNEKSEKAYFRKFEIACSNSDLFLIKSSFANWLQRISEKDKKYSPQIMAELTNNSELFQLSKELDKVLFGKAKKGESENKWNSNKFFQSVKKSRNAFLKLEKESKNKENVPPLNPKT